MIRAGTACYIVRRFTEFDWRGRVVTVVGPDPEIRQFLSVSAEWMPPPPDGDYWAMLPSSLRPIHGPDAEQSIRETDTVRDHDEITRRLTA